MLFVGTLSRAFVVLLGLVTVAEARPRARHRVAKHRPVAAARAVGVDVPWNGKLAHPSQFPDGEGYVIRRPWRSYGTERTVELTHEVVTDTIAEFPDRHVLAIGDFSAEHGGRITEHASHQTGHDVDIGLYYTEKPRNYPRDFVSANEDNLDCEATWGLIDRFIKTADEDGGAKMIFLDFNVQGILYRWAKDNGVSEKKLDRVFQFPHGRSSSDGFVRHWPNHDNHIHVRFK
jgi:murein endopeptidase